MNVRILHLWACIFAGIPALCGCAQTQAINPVSKPAPVMPSFDEGNPLDDFALGLAYTNAFPEPDDGVSLVIDYNLLSFVWVGAMGAWNRFHPLARFCDLSLGDGWRGPERADVYQLTLGDLGTGDWGEGRP